MKDETIKIAIFAMDGCHRNPTLSHFATTGSCGSGAAVESLHLWLRFFGIRYSIHPRHLKSEYDDPLHPRSLFNSSLKTAPATLRQRINLTDMIISQSRHTCEGKRGKEGLVAMRDQWNVHGGHRETELLDEFLVQVLMNMRAGVTGE